MTTTTSKTCASCQRQFMLLPEDHAFLEYLDIPEPTFGPDCRLRRRLAFRNERSLYKRICDLCHREIISMYTPTKDFTVYCPECFHSDSWDPLAYGRDYDFSQPFFLQ